MADLYSGVERTSLVAKPYFGEIEPIDYYQKGGYYPVNLGETFGDRYKVVHKLGYGPHSTTWLCEDNSLDNRLPSFKAVKVFKASVNFTDSLEANLQAEIPEDAHIRVIEHSFDLKSSAGTHHALVYPLLGPPTKVKPAREQTKEDEAALRKSCRRLVESIVWLHQAGVCHGSIYNEKVLPIIASTDKEFPASLGRPGYTPVYDPSGPNECAPDNIVFSIPWEFVPETTIVTSPGDTFLIGLSNAYRSSEPQTYKGPPLLKIASPEWLLEDKAGRESDMWALGCTIFQLRTGTYLLPAPSDDLTSMDDYLANSCEILGQMPEPWWSETWEGRSEHFQDESTADKQPIYLAGEPRRCIKEVVAFHLRHGPEDSSNDEEIDLLANLLDKTMKWKPEERITAGEMLSHAWFNL